MQVKILLDDKRYNWVSKNIGNIDVCFKGLLWFDSEYYQGDKACNELSEIFKLFTTSNSNDVKQVVKRKLSKLSGHFSFIISNPNITIAMVDKIRSYPIYYFQKTKILHISNSATELRERYNGDLNEISESSILAFKMSGYTLGNDTLYENLYQLQAGECIIIDKKRSFVETYRYYKYFKDEVDDKSERELLDDLHEATINTFTKMIKSLNGRPVFIPLSGGYDSRLVLTMLLEFKYDNIFTFTYGIKGHCEIERARVIAKHLGVPWRYIRFTPKQTKELFYTDDRIKYSNFGSGFNSIASLPEYYSMIYLQQAKIIPDDAVIINGQTGDFTSGGHIPQVLKKFYDRDILTIEFLLNLIIDKHFSLWINLKTKENISIISKNLLHLLDLSKDKLSLEEFAKYFELYEWGERQSKHVVNGQRAYDWLGYDWRLPLWSDELMEFWMNVPWGKKISQKLLFNYLKIHDFSGVFNALEVPPSFTYQPQWINFLKPIVFIANKITNNNYFSQKYLRYFMAYAPFYPQENYCKYLKDSAYHRNVVSYWTEYYLKDLL